MNPMALAPVHLISMLSTCGLPHFYLVVRINFVLSTKSYIYTLEFSGVGLIIFTRVEAGKYSLKKVDLPIVPIKLQSIFLWHIFPDDLLLYINILAGFYIELI